MESYLRKDKDEIEKDIERVYELFPIPKDTSTPLRERKTS